MLQIRSSYVKFLAPPLLGAFAPAGLRGRAPAGHGVLACRDGNNELDTLGSCMRGADPLHVCGSVGMAR
jgi:hypothetical protein